ncbi:MAG: hypothetical protein M3511_11535 [Deinococcota bacterium]|nr:hypothetical protein [Deinococcota bacterium]
MSKPPKTKDATSSGQRSEQHSKRGDPAYAQVAGMIPLELRRRFKAKVALEGKDMSQVLEKLIREYG